VPSDYVTRLRALGVSYFPSPSRAFRALARLIAASARDAIDAEDAPLTVTLPHGGVIPEFAAKHALASAGVVFPRGRMATTIAEAQAIAAEIGYPVVLKAQAQALSHKSDAGGVILNLADAAAVDAGWTRLHANIAANAPGVTLDGALVEAMGARGLELIVGGRNDPDWGPVVLVGFGGVQAEVLQDVVLLPADLPQAAIVAALRGLKSGAILDGWRGAPALDIAAAAALIGRVGRLLRGTQAIREIDLNPVVLYPAGQGIVVLDALILAD
jgi:acyl-CoA synthetase (NDP forming)